MSLTGPIIKLDHFFSCYIVLWVIFSHCVFLYIIQFIVFCCFWANFEVCALCASYFWLCLKMVIRLVFLSLSTIWTVKYCTKFGIFELLFLFHFIIFYILSSCLLPARLLFLIVLHNDITNIHVRGVWFLIWYWNGECSWFTELYPEISWDTFFEFFSENGN